ncbi:MAG: ABC transporter ATP-binding protein [Tepidisphaeraceae bacterium]
MSNRELRRWMFHFVRPVRSLVALACTWLALWVVVEVLAVRQVAQGVNLIQYFAADQRGSGSMLSNLRHLALVLGVLVLALAVLRYLREVANTKMSMHTVFFIREAVYDKIQRLGFGFHGAISSGQLINRALSDLQNVRAFIQTAILTTLEIVLVVGGYIVLIHTRSGLLAMISILPLPLWTFYVLRFSKKVQPAAKAVFEAEDRNVSLITENIAGVHVVKSFATEAQEIAKYAAHCDSFRQRVLARIRLFADFTPIIRSIAMGSNLTLFLAASILTIQGRLGPGDFFILGTALGAILTRLQLVATINEQYQNAIVSSRRLYEVLTARPTVPEMPGALALPPGPGNVVFERVNFGYRTDKLVLRDINLHVKGGSIVAIVGPTGAGKTTLVNLISRFYDPRDGRIVIDGLDLHDATLTSLRTQVAFVFQETYLFSDTVAANIAYGRPGITRGEIEAAARLAQAHDFIESMPKGYDAMLGERGASLSGGQRQRLAIARAIVTNPRILILDDATAAVDPQTEHLIRRGMRFVMKGRTTFVIAHRVSTVKQADLVVVLEDGRITQMGTHSQLMEQDGHYRDIAAVQLYGDSIERDEEGDLPSHMDRITAARAGFALPPLPSDQGDLSQ